ncbi:hypothetical protein EDD86DRAFT_80371 [Gorgonomyces haynaldii]|nr:hypothetical protein EDD86DRAFT_80371 [Gorgonomyces haynaldii]
MEDKIIQDTLQDIAVEIESFLNLFKSQVQFEISIQKQYIDHASMESHNNFVEKNFETRWEMIKTLVYLLAKHLKDEKVENALETHVPQIDAIRDFLVKKHSPFRDHEYQLPFHTLRLLKALKSCVAKDQQKEERPVMEMERKQTVMDKAKFFQDEISRVAGSPKKLPNLPKKKPEQKKQVLAMFDEALIDMKTGQEPLTSVLLVETPSTVGPTEKLYRPQIKKLVQDQQVTIDDMSALEKELFSLLPDMVSEEVEFRVGAKGEVISQALVPEDLPEEKEKQVVVAEGPLSDLVNANQALSSRRREIRKTMMLGDFSLMQQLTAQFANMTEEFVPGHAKSDSQSTIMKPEPKFYRPTETMTQVVEEEPKVPKKPAPILPNKEARSSVNKPMSPKLASPGLKAAPLLQDVQRLSLSKPGLEEGRSSETKSPTKKAPVLPPKTKPLPPPKPASHSGFPSLPPTPSHTQSVVEVKPVAPFVQEVKPETPSAVEAKPETASTVEVKQDTQPVQEQVKEAPSVVEQVKETQAATEVKEAPKEEVHDVVQETVKTVVEPAQVVEAVTEPANERQQPQVEQPLVETSREQEPVIEQQVEPQIEQSQESVHVHHSVDTITQSVETMHHSAEQLNPAVPASTRQSVVQSARHSFVQPARQSVHEPVLQSVRHSVHEPVTKPVRQSVTQPVRQSMTQPQTIDPVKTETPIEQIAEAQTVTRPDLPTEDAGPSYDDQEDIMNMYQRRSTAHKDIPTFQAPSVSIDAFAPVEQEIEIRFEKQGSQSSIETVIPKKAGTLMYQPGENGSLDRNLDQRESQGADDSQEESQQTQEQTVEAQPEQTVLAASAEQLNPDMYDDILTDYGRKVSQVIRQSMLAKQIRMSRPPEPNPPLPIDQAASQESSRPVSEIHILAPLDLEPLQAIKTSPQDVLLFSPEEISTLFTSLASAKVEEEKPKIPEPPVTKTVAFVRDSQPEQKGDPTATVFPATSIFDPDHGDYSNVINEKDLEQPPVVSGIDILAVELCPVKNEFQILMIPLNAMFDFCVYSLGKPLRLGRNNTEGRPNFKAYGTLVVSRNHAEIYVNDGMVLRLMEGVHQGHWKQLWHVQKQCKTESARASVSRSPNLYW